MFVSVTQKLRVKFCYFPIVWNKKIEDYEATPYGALGLRGLVLHSIARGLGHNLYGTLGVRISGTLLQTKCHVISLYSQYIIFLFQKLEISILKLFTKSFI